MDKARLIALMDKSIQGTLTPEEEKELTTYEAQFDEKSNFLDSLDEQEKENLNRDIRSKIIVMKGEEPIIAKRNKVISFKWISIAASLLIICGFSYFLLRDYWGQRAAQDKVFLAGKEIREMILEDGTVVYLNAGSELRLAEGFGARHRQAILKGEAFFHVKRNAQLPFHLETNKGLHVHVLGTQFNVDARSDKQTVALVSGKVQTYLGDQQKVELKPDEIVSFSKNGEHHLQKGGLANILSWKPVGLSIDNMQLKELAQVLEKLYDYKIYIKTSHIQDTRITLVIRDEDQLFDILEMLKLINGIDYIEKDGNIQLYK